MLQHTFMVRHKTTELKVMVSINFSIIIAINAIIAIINIIINFAIIDMSYDILHVTRIGVLC
jgi:hypothetical protein